MVGIIAILYGVFGIFCMIGISMALEYKTTTMQDIAMAILWPIALTVGITWLLYKSTVGITWLLYKSIVELVKFIKSWNWSTKS